MKTREQLESTLTALRREYGAVGAAIDTIQEELKHRFVWPEKAKSVGKCYKYRNSSGGPKWWLYRRIVGFKNGVFWTVEIQMDDDNVVSVNERRWDSDATGIYTEITVEEYAQAVKPLLKRVVELVEP